MSPITRWLRNCTPLTTWPSRTSRHGTIRFVSMSFVPYASLQVRANLVRRDSTLEQRLTGNRACDPGPRERREIRRVADAAGSLHRERRPTPHHVGIEVEVRSCERTVAGDVGAKHMRQPLRQEALDRVAQRQ